jgi:hypothetical protein
VAQVSLGSLEEPTVVFDDVEVVPCALVEGRWSNSRIVAPGMLGRPVTGSRWASARPIRTSMSQLS